MTSLLRRKRRTTAPRTRAGTGCKLALFLSLFGGTAEAQQPGRQPVQQQANGLYPPPGYRQRTPPPQAAPPAERGMSGAGRVMYFHKPADALLPAEPQGEGVALAATSDPVPPVGVPDVPVSTPGPGMLPTPRSVPAIPTSSPILPTPSALPAHPSTATATQPGSPPAAAFPQPAPHTVQRRKEQVPPPDPAATQLPPRSTIFQMYNDEALAKVLARSIREDRIRTWKQSVEDAAKAGKEPPILFAPPLDDPYWKLPQLPQIAPPGVAYAPKSAVYPPRVAYVEPSYVVHRRLHFEEKNSERYGWDLGIIQPLVSTAYFYKDTLLWPHSLVAGCVHGQWDTSAGKCLPGSPVPYYLYPPGLTITGTVAEAGLITGLSFVFP